MRMTSIQAKVYKGRFSMAVIFTSALVGSCGWVDSTGVPEQPGPLLVSLTENNTDIDARQLDLTAESTQNVDISLLRRDLEISTGDVSWTPTGAGNVAACSAITNRSDVGTSLLEACDRRQYTNAGSNIAVSSAASNAAEPDSCSIFIIESATDNIGSRAQQSVYDIHTPALENPVALAYSIDFTQVDGSRVRYPVNLCIQP